MTFRVSVEEFKRLQERRIGEDAERRPSKPTPTRITNSLYPLVQLCIFGGLPAPIPEYRFHATRGWRFDYAWPMHKIAVEVEGAIWKKGGGGHSHPSGIERDIEKYNAAAVDGWRVLRYAPEKLGNAIADLERMLR